MSDEFPELFIRPAGRILSVGGRPVGDSQTPKPIDGAQTAIRSAAATRQPAATQLSDPIAGEAAVALDIDARTATVLPVGTDLVAMLWRRGYQAMARDPYGRPAVWADGVRGKPAGGGLTFSFPKGHPGWPKLVGAATSTAIVTVDRRTSSILGVKFRGA